MIGTRRRKLVPASTGMSRWIFLYFARRIAGIAIGLSPTNWDTLAPGCTRPLPRYFCGEWASRSRLRLSSRPGFGVRQWLYGTDLVLLRLPPL